MRCENCGGVVNGDNICLSCGLINGQVLVPPNPRFNPDEESNGGQHLSYPAKNLGTDFIPDNKSNYSKFCRLRRLNRRAGNHKKLKAPTWNIAKLCGWLGLPHSVRDEASYLFRKFDNKGTDTRVLACVVIWITCRRRGIPRTEGEVLKFAPHLEQSVNGGRRKITQKLFRKIVHRVVDELEIELPPAKPEQYLPRFAYRLGLGSEELAEAYRLLREANTHNGHPITIVSTVLYLAGGGTIREVAEACGVSDGTIAKNLEKIRA